MTDVTEELKKKYEIEGDEGVVVVGIKRGGRAARAGLQQGELILKLRLEDGDREVRNVAEFMELIEKIPEDENIVLWTRFRGSARYVLIKP